MSFVSQLNKFEKNSIKATTRIQRGFIISLFNAVIQDTPVLSGRLRGNWQTTVTQPATGELDRIDKTGDKVRREVNKNTSEQALKDEEPIFLTNNLPYANRIEFDGHSKVKAPAGMVRKNVLRLNELISKAVAANRNALK